MTNKNYFLITGSSSGLGENLVINLNEKGFKTIVLLTHEARYIDKIKDRIISSIEVLKEEQK